MPDAWFAEPVPGLTLADALARVAGAESLVCLAAGRAGATVLAWDVPVRAIDGYADLANLERRLESRARDDDGREGWLDPLHGDFVIQLDYEFPRAIGRAWRLMRYVSWDREGRATLHAYDGAGLETLRADLARPPRPLPSPRLTGALTGAWDAAGHRQRVGRIRDLIAAGDLYQANLTLPFTGALVAQPDVDAALFLDLIERSPATCAALLRGGGDSVVSHSPERFLRLAAGILESAPIKGTR